MHSSFLSRWTWRRYAAVGSVALGVTLTSCTGVTDSLLKADTPDIIPPGQLRNAEGALGLANGALGTFRSITAGDESTWLFGGLLGDEWSTSSTFPQNDETDQRHIQLNNFQVTVMLYRLYRTRTQAIEAITALNQYAPTRKTLIGELYFAKGFAEMQLAQDFCNGIPISTFVGGRPVPGVPETGSQVFARAVASFDSALAYTTNTTDTTVLRVARAAAIGKGRALLGLGRYADAAAALSVAAVKPPIPSAFAYVHTFALTTGTNTIWGQGFSAQRYVVGDSLEGNSRNIVVKNAIPFASAQDPRLPVERLTTNGQDGQTRVRRTSLYGQLTPIDVVNGIDARMIEAEAALSAGDTATFYAIHNGLRAAPPRLGTVTPAALPPLVDPGTPELRVSLHFYEKAFWTFSRGQRLGDMRRLVKTTQYARPDTLVFPVGTHYKGGVYGRDVNLPIVTDERNNPLFKGCLDRAA
ncbi:MAG: hypothetical protein NVS4B3_27690 [Gemmatimonadaceae bacterium]